LKQFADWLYTTAPSRFIQGQEAWMIPTIQSIHIVGIGLVVGSVLMITMRIFGWAGVDQTLRQTHDRFGPWLTGSLWLMAVTGLLMVIGEPPRELLAFSFWVKMGLVAVVVAIAAFFNATLRKYEQDWEETRIHRGSTKLLAAVTLVLLVCIIFLGRFIAYDHVWGALSPAAGG
jgi:hypothetical protein